MEVGPVTLWQERCKLEGEVNVKNNTDVQKNVTKD